LASGGKRLILEEVIKKMYFEIWLIHGLPKGKTNQKNNLKFSFFFIKLGEELFFEENSGLIGQKEIL